MYRYALPPDGIRSKAYVRAVLTPSTDGERSADRAEPAEAPDREARAEEGGARRQGREHEEEQREDPRDGERPLARLGQGGVAAVEARAQGRGPADVVEQVEAGQATQVSAPRKRSSTAPGKAPRARIPSTNA